MMADVIRGDARTLPLPDASVDLIVTSPPYWSLRSYTDNGEHYDAQIGGEVTPAAYIDSLIDCTREWMRVLKPSGSLFVNLGDKYARSGGVDRKERSVPGTGDIGNRKAGRQPQRGVDGVADKSLIGLPWRYALRCIDDLGLILRAEIIWSKPNGLPESVTDRVRRSHETWFHMVKSPRYFSAVDAIREPHAPWTLKAYAYEQKNGGYNRRTNPNRVDEGDASDYAVANPLGKLPGSVWEIATQPLKVPADLGVDHFAAFPMEWPRRIILGWSPSGICTACGEGRRPVAERSPMLWRESPTIAGRSAPGASRKPMSGAMLAAASSVITGEACACPDASAPTRPAVVLDSFGGTGTVALVADALGRHGISVDYSGDYCRLAAWRTTDPGQRAAALQIEKPPVVPDWQPDLMSLSDTE
jgi:DNA modification methylase